MFRSNESCAVTNPESLGHYQTSFDTCLVRQLKNAAWHRLNLHTTTHPSLCCLLGSETSGVSLRAGRTEATPHDNSSARSVATLGIQPPSLRGPVKRSVQ